MVKKFIQRFNSFKNNWEPAYIGYCELPIDERLVLLEGGQGSNINGNMFAMLKELSVIIYFAVARCLRYSFEFLTERITSLKP